MREEAEEEEKREDEIRNYGLRMRIDEERAMKEGGKQVN